jgi:antitoxin ParD1/3/4
MATRTSMNISLTPELAEFVKSRVASGRYQSDSEVVRHGLRLLEEHELALAELRKKIAKGIDQADRGELLDGQAVFAKLKKRSEVRRRKHG